MLDMSRKKEIWRKCELVTFPWSGLEPVNQGFTERSFKKEDEVEIEKLDTTAVICQSPIKAQIRRWNWKPVSIHEMNWMFSVSEKKTPLASLGRFLRVVMVQGLSLVIPSYILKVSPSVPCFALHFLPLSFSFLFFFKISIHNSVFRQYSSHFVEWIRSECCP